MTTPPPGAPGSVTGTVATDRGERYVKQLGDHFGRKIEVRETDTGRLVLFPAGSCLMSVEPERIVLTAHSTDSAGLATVQDVVTRHLERFGARDELQVVWTS